MNIETIYVDTKNHCYRVNDGTMIAVQTGFFYGKCVEFVEGHCCEAKGDGVLIYPWKALPELEAAQREYERQQLADYKAACERMGIVV